jgi:hypothetical protein
MDRETAVVIKDEDTLSQRIQHGLTTEYCIEIHVRGSSLLCL